MHAVGSRYLATRDKIVEALIFGVVIYGVSRSMKLLQLPVVAS
jgi:hypothetical protein